MEVGAKGKVLSKVNQIGGSDFKNMNNLTSMTSRLVEFKEVSLKGETYIFGGYDRDENLNRAFNPLVRKYSRVNKSWS